VVVVVVEVAIQVPLHQRVVLAVAVMAVDILVQRVLMGQRTRVVVVAVVLVLVLVVRVSSFSVTSHLTHPQQVSLLAVEL
jgi:hypothetical protein